MMQVAHARLPVVFLALLVAGAASAKDSCPRFFAPGGPPSMTNPKLAADAVPLCYGAFAVLYSGVSRTPLYAGERLTRASVAAARSVERADAFHEETRLPENERASLSDYTHSGYDRGHMAPAGDMPTPDAQAESFTLANIVPQNRTVNRSLWAAIEESVRRLATRRGELFVVTGPIFSGKSIPSLDGRVLVPTQLYKAVYDPASGEAAAYLAPNDGEGEWQTVSIAALKDIAGLDAFPGLSDRDKRQAMRLPEPRAFSRDGGRSGREDASLDSWLRNEAHRAFRRLWRNLMRSIF